MKINFEGKLQVSKVAFEAEAVCGDGSSLRRVGAERSHIRGCDGSPAAAGALLLRFSGSPGINKGTSPHAAFYAVIKVKSSISEDTQGQSII